MECDDAPHPGRRTKRVLTAEEVKARYGRIGAKQDNAGGSHAESGANPVKIVAVRRRIHAGWDSPFIRGVARLLPAFGMAIALIAGGVWSGAIRHDPSPAFLARWGYDLDALRIGRLDTLVTMALFPTASGDWLPMMLQTVTLVALIGWYAGAWWAVTAFWIPNVIGTALVSLCVIWPLDVAGYQFAHGWATEPDSGASVGIYGAFGFLLALMPRRVRRVMVAGMAGWLILGIVRERHVWNVEHLGGYVLGVTLAIGKMGGRSPREDRSR